MNMDNKPKRSNSRNDTSSIEKMNCLYPSNLFVVQKIDQKRCLFDVHIWYDQKNYMNVVTVLKPGMDSSRKRSSNKINRAYKKIKLERVEYTKRLALNRYIRLTITIYCIFLRAGF